MCACFNADALSYPFPEISCGFVSTDGWAPESLFSNHAHLLLLAWLTLVLPRIRRCIQLTLYFEGHFCEIFRDTSQDWVFPM